MSEVVPHLIEEGIRQHRAGLLGRAARLFKRVQPDDPRYPEALARAAKVRLEQGWTSEAATTLERSLELLAEHPLAWLYMGEVRQRMRRTDDAARCFRRAAILAPAMSEGYLGLAKREGHKVPLSILKRCLRIAPTDPALNLEIAEHYRDQNALPEARRWFQRYLGLKPGAADALFSLGNVNRDLGSVELASEQYRRTLWIAPGAYNVLNNQGLLDFQQENWAAAEKQFDAAIRAKPDMFIAWLNRARALSKLSVTACLVLEKPDFVDATIRSYKRAIILQPTDTAAYGELGTAMGESRSVRRAMVLNPLAHKTYLHMALLAAKRPLRRGVRDLLRRAALLEPSDPDTWHGLCVDFARSGDLAGSAKHGLAATLINDNMADAHLNTAFALLALEDFKHGWEVHRRRFETSEGKALRRRFEIPEWRTEAIEGRHLLLWGEQGIGDEVQFLTLVPGLLRHGAILTIFVEPRLRPILRRSFPDISVPDVPAPTGMVEDHHGAELHLALGDLPHRLSLFCGGEARPDPWIVPDADRVATIRSSLTARRPGKYLVGITWRSIAPKTGPRRSIDSFLWREFADIAEVSLVSLQYGATYQDAQDFEIDAGIHLDMDHGIEPLDDLDGLAALVSAVDLVICPANNTVHFAGALAKPCWTLLPVRPDWRWGLTRSDSLWYPRTRVYRQNVSDHWAPVMETVRKDLKAWASGLT